MESTKHFWITNRFGADTNDPKKVVVHAMSEFLRLNDGEAVHATSFLNMIGLSVHAFVTPSGSILRSRRDNEGAFHAGRYNRNSLGVEILVPGCHDTTTFHGAIEQPNWCGEIQFVAAAGLVGSWCATYSIPRGEVWRHSDLDPGRNKDPGAGFPWEAFLEAL